MFNNHKLEPFKNVRTTAGIFVYMGYVKKRQSTTLTVLEKSELCLLMNSTVIVSVDQIDRKSFSQTMTTNTLQYFVRADTQIYRSASASRV